MTGLKARLCIGAGAFIMFGITINMPGATGEALRIEFSPVHAASHAAVGQDAGSHGAAPHDPAAHGPASKAVEPAKGKSAAVADSKVAFIKNLSLIEGHLMAGMILYKEGAQEAARSHMKHPSDELYAALAPGMKEFGAASFAESLEKMAVAVEQKKPLADVEKAFDTVRVEIERARLKSSPDVKTRLSALSQLISVAGDEFGEGVKDGKVVNAHEYQDAYGFVMAGRHLLTGAISSNLKQKTAVEQCREALKEVESAWSSLSGDSQVKTDVRAIRSVAARIESAAGTL